MKIGSIIFADPFVSLAPLAGYGDTAFRRICREYGASLTVTEMVSVKGLVYGNEKTETLLSLAPNESPSCVQLFGSDPEYFYKAVKLPQLNKFDIIDINMGCPVPKVTKCGEGSALMNNPSLAADIVRACVDAANGRPVTVKHRLGQNGDSINSAEFAETMQKAGAAAITVHGRTVKQGYGGSAAWDEIGKTAKAVDIPVIGNGDILSIADAKAAIKNYGVAGVAIGRGALGHPEVFAEQDKHMPETLLKHIEYALLYLPERVAVRTMRKHLCKYLAGTTGTKELRLKINAAETAEQLISELVKADYGKQRYLRNEEKQ